MRLLKRLAPRAHRSADGRLAEDASPACPSLGPIPQVAPCESKASLPALRRTCRRERRPRKSRAEILKHGLGKAAAFFNRPECLEGI